MVAHEGTKLALARSVGSSVMGAGTMSGLDCSMQLVRSASRLPRPAKADTATAVPPIMPLSLPLQVGVAMILGFFMLWDLPTITRGVQSLQNSRLAPVHAELAPALTVFGKLFGRALEAQARIALVNTGLTMLGMWLLAIPGMGLLSLFVFICSFIPIAGVIISTTPIGFVALTEYGFIKLALVILMVTGVHFVEVRGSGAGKPG